MLSASLGGSARSASGFYLGFFQITASVLGLGVCEILCAPFKGGVSLSYSPLALLYSSPAGLQSHMFWGVVFPVQDLRLGRTSAIVILFPFVGCLPGSVGLDYTMSVSLLPISLWFLLYIFSCGNLFY